MIHLYHILVQSQYLLYEHLSSVGMVRFEPQEAPFLAVEMLNVGQKKVLEARFWRQNRGAKTKKGGISELIAYCSASCAGPTRETNQIKTAPPYLSA